MITFVGSIIIITLIVVLVVSFNGVINPRAAAKSISENTEFSSTQIDINSSPFSNATVSSLGDKVTVSSLGDKVQYEHESGHNGNHENESNEKYGCIGERIENEQKLRTGQYLCSKSGKSIFGIDDNGTFTWENEKKGLTQVLYKGNAGDYFMLKEDGRFVVYSSEGAIIWSKNCKAEVHWSPKCLSSYDCPYLHLHGGGTIVLNWISSDVWNERNINKLYDFSKE